MIVVPATVEHARAIRDRLQPMQAVHAGWLMDEANVTEIFGAGPSYAALDGERVLAIGGVMEQERGAGRGWAWAWLADELTRREPLVRYAGRRMCFVHQAALRFLETAPFRRIEIAVAMGHSDGCKWAHALGFRWEALMRSWLPSGGHANLYARVK